MEGNQYSQNSRVGQRGRVARSPFERMLAFAVAFCTVFAMIPPSAVLAVPEQVLDCPLVVHQHEAACYDGEGALICGMADFVVHTHDDSCYDADSTLVCKLTEVEAHEHTDACFTTGQTLTCELEVDENHTHGEDCYETVQTQVCTKEVIVLHTHSDACRDENGDLICGELEVIEHIHDDNCFTGTASGNTTPTEATTQPTSETTIETTAETTVETTVETTTETTVETTTEATEAPVMPLAAEIIASGTCGSGVNWVLTDDGVLTISGSGNMNNYKSSTSGRSPWYSYRSQIKSVITENGVTSIGAYAFYNCSSLTSIAIPNSVTSIGNYAFSKCSNLTSITLPNGITSIPADAFSYCSSLSYITIPASVTSIGASAFSSCRSLTSVTIPNSVTSIGNYAFDNCSNLTSVTIPNSVTSIGNSAFSGCSRLTSITIPDSVTSIGKSAFYACNSLSKIEVDANNPNYRSIDGVLYSKDQTKLIQYPASKTDSTDVIIPEGVTSIGDYAFYDCDSLVSVTLPEGVTSIGNYTFSRCGSLTSITIPDSVTYIGSSAFRDCLELAHITIENGLANIGIYAFFDCTQLKHVTIGKNASVITSDILDTLGAASGGITDISFQGPNYFTYTGSDYVFNQRTLSEGTYYVDEHGALYRLHSDGTATLLYCPEALVLAQYTVLSSIPSEDAGMTYTVTTIGNFALKDCAGLAGIVIPDSVSTIGHLAFHNCTGITSITIPDSVTSLGNFAFYNCVNLASVNGEAALPAVMQTWAFAGANTTTFQNTALSGEVSLPGATEDIEIEDNTGRKIKLSTSDTQLLTGKTAQTILTIDKGNEDSTSVVRVYFQFVSEHGGLNYPVGTYTFDGISASVCESSIPYTYYVEIQPLLAGQTLNLSLNSVYKNIVSGGGSVLIWVDSLPTEEAAALGNGVTTPQAAHKVTWTTQADTFQVTKSARPSSVTLIGNGTAEGPVTLQGLEYDIDVTCNKETTDYGKDHMVSIDFVDTLILPEGFRWRDGLTQAILENNWSAAISPDHEYIYSVTFGGKTYELAIISGKDVRSGIRGGKLTVDDTGNIRIHWTFHNPNTATEMPSIDITVSYGEAVIVADTDTLSQKVSDANTSITCAFDNQIAVTQHFTHSADQTQEAAATKTISVGAARYDIYKKFLHQNITMGEYNACTITLKNKSALPYTALSYVTDPLPDYFYITPGDMHSMFYSDPYGKDLSITIEHATLCTPISNAVIGTDGNSYVITQQYQGVNTPHNHEETEDESILTADVTLAIRWSEDHAHLVLTMDEESWSIGPGCDYPDIESTLNGLGYVVTSSAAYTCRWDQVGQALYGGESREFLVRSTVKDTFMRLRSDQAWYIISGDIYERSVDNYAYSYSVDNSKKTVSAYAHIYRDFTLFKKTYLNGVLADESTSIESGDVLFYQATVNHIGSNSYTSLPLVDHMEGAQALLVSVADNPSLADKGLESMEVGGQSFYILSQTGQYPGVIIGGYLADHVEVQATDDGIVTTIYWYLTDVGGDTTITVEYPVLVCPERANHAYQLSNNVWLNDHQTHRLYAQTSGKVTIVRMSKHIVTNLSENELGNLAEHDPSVDILAERSVIEEGQAVTYRLMLESPGASAQTVRGNSMQDSLPASIDGFWNKDNVSITYISAEGSSVQIENGDSWRIESDVNDSSQQHLRWNDDFSAVIHGTLYIYVTLTFPTGTQWSDYCHAYGDMSLSNTFHVYHLQDEVFHFLAAPSEVLLQKGVYETGTITQNVDYHYFFIAHSEENSLLYYAKDAPSQGLVTYYVALYNRGDSRVYLSDIQDVLPEGFTYLAPYGTSKWIDSFYSTANNSSYFSSLISVNSPNQGRIRFKEAHIQVSLAENANGQQVVTFSLGNSGEAGNLRYDEELEKYYLSSNEAVVFAYHCKTNHYRDLQGPANNIVTMPFYDYSGAGATIDTATTIDRATSNGMTSNNGGCSLLTNGQAALQGVNTSGKDDSTQWLTSEVALDRGGIQPGIQKTAADSFAHVTAPITWSVRISNNGTENINGYTFTDVMMKPYQFTGAVNYQLNYDNYPSLNVDGSNLFTFGQRAPDDTTVTITSNSGHSAELTIDGGYQELTARLYWKDSNSYDYFYVTLQVSLSQDDSGNEVLSIIFPTDSAASASVPADGYVTISLQTQNFSGTYRNTSVYNTAYITPRAEQPFDTGAVSQGSYTIYNGADSVVSETNVAVSFGYATTSLKTVTELSDLSNSASSIGSTNHIVLNDAASPFRYVLTVNNTGGTATSQAMDLFVLVDNLPQVGDHVTFYPEISRFSEFQVNFSENPLFAVSVDGRVLDPSAYTLQFTTATEFGDNDFNGTSTDGWYTLDQINADASLSLKNMRSFRIVLQDETGTVIPANAQIVVSFNAEIDLSEGDIPPAATAWNSFGYHYSLIGDTTELQASPQKVGVRIASIPCLAKELQDTDGNTYNVKTDTSFHFVIYEGSAVALPNAYTREDVFSALAGSTFTVVELTVKAGESASQAIALDGLCCYRYENGNLVKTDSPWVWKNQTRYTLLELPMSDSIYQFGSFNKTQPNNYTFAYDASSTQVFTCTNICAIWNILVEKQCADTRTSLSGAVFGLYSPSSNDLISEENFTERTAQLQAVPQKVLEVEGSTWYLQDIQATDDNGQIQWSNLAEMSYYLLELQAPDGYVLNKQPGQEIQASNAKTVFVTVTNAPQYTLPLTGSSGVTGFYAAGAALTGLSLWMGYRKERKSKGKRKS